MNLEKLMRPKSIAVAGATEREGSFGNAAAVNTLQSAIKEHVYFVNPTKDKVLGVKCYQSLKDLPEVVDCIVICTPKATIIPYLKEAGALGVGAAVVYASGFAEEHSEDGTAMEDEIVALSKQYQMPILGPNCAGYLNNEDKINMWGLRADFDMQERTGGIGIVAQSGFIGHSLMTNPYFNVSYAISSGNGNATMLEQFLDYLVDDDRVKVVAMYLEGIKDAKRFTSALAKAAKKRKPVVIIKSGKSAKGAAAAASHTGNLAGAAAAYEAIFERYGVMSVDSLEEFMCLAQLFSVLGDALPKRATFAGINLSGGENTMCADLSEKHGVVLPDLQPDTVKEMEKYLPAFATAQNPLDGTTALLSRVDSMLGVIKALEADAGIGGILFGVTIRDKLAGPAKTITDAVLLARKEGYRKPVFYIASQETTKGKEIRIFLESNSIVLTSCSEIAYMALGKLSKFIQYDYAKMTTHIAAPERSKKGLEKVALSEFDSKEEMVRCGIAVPRQSVAKCETELKEQVAQMQYPLVLKINSPDILHKTEAGGVKLNICDEAQAVEAYRSILSSCKAYQPDARIDGILVQEMAPQGTEIIVGVTNDAQFGPMILVGLGGVFVEIFKDATLCPCPVNKDEALGMIKRLKAYKLLQGYRGSAPRDVEALADLIVKVSEYALAHKDEIAELDLNPVFVYEKGVMAVDALVVKYV